MSQTRGPGVGTRRLDTVIRRGDRVRRMDTADKMKNLLVTSLLIASLADAQNMTVDGVLEQQNGTSPSLAACRSPRRSSHLVSLSRLSVGAVEPVLG